MIKSTQPALLGALAAVCLCATQSQAVTPDQPALAAPAAVAEKAAAEKAAPAEAKKESLFADPVIAKGKGFEIKRSRVDDAYIIYKANLAARNAQGAPNEPRDLVESNLLQRIIFTEILLSKANPEEKAKAKDLTEKFIDDTRKRSPSEEIFTAQIKATGMSMEQFRDRALEQNTCELVLDRVLKDKIVISDDAAKKFYDENPSQFEQGERVRASHILISTLDKDTQQPVSAEQKKVKETLAKELKARAEKGEDFAKLAKEYSDDPGSKETGGEYTFPRGQMVKEFEAAAFSLQTNQVSDVVETRFGYHVIKLSEKLPAAKIEFAKVSTRLKDYLQDREFSSQLPDFLGKLKAEAAVEIVGKKPAEAPAAK